MFSPNLGQTSLLLLKQYYGLTVNPGIFPIKCGGIRGLGHAGGSVDSEVHLLGKLDESDVVVLGRTIIVLVVVEGGHIYRHLRQTSLHCTGKVVIS